VLRKHPFTQATLSDEDLSVNFADHTRETDRVAVVVTAPLTTDEAWVAFEPGRLYRRIQVRTATRFNEA
jgi:glutamine amidotransferase